MPYMLVCLQWLRPVGVQHVEQCKWDKTVQDKMTAYVNHYT